jgi:hypothetical protein
MFLAFWQGNLRVFARRGRASLPLGEERAKTE